MPPRQAPITRGVVAFRGLCIDAERYTASLDSKPLKLTRTEFRLMFILLAYPGYTYTRAQFINMLHPGESAASERAIDCHVANLRRKLRAIRPSTPVIYTVYGIGYKLDI